MSELAAGLLVPVTTPAEVDDQLGSLKVTDAASTNRVAAVDDRLELMPVLDGRTGTTSAMATRPTGVASVSDGQSVTVDDSESHVAGRRPWERPVNQARPRRRSPSSQTAEPSGERWGAPHVVAATKLTIPRWRRPLVPRPGLSARLDEDCRMAIVSAPAGYGKTAALAMWAAEHRDRVAWLSCDPADAEPTRFMAGLLAALATRWPGVADDAYVLLERDGADIYDAAAAVANELATISPPGVIVVDDLHLAAPDPALLTAFTEALPDAFRFAADTRSDPPMSLARLRMRGDLIELRAADLSFSPDELSEFLVLYDICLTGDELLRLHDLTEGWPAGAQLAAIALQRGVGHEEFLQAFAGTDRAVSDFLVSELSEASSANSR